MNTTARKKPPIPPRPVRIHCECVHYDALTCIAETHHMTRFNASLVFATSGERNGRCTCPCHLDNGNPISEQDWLVRKAQQTSTQKHPAHPEEIEA